MSNQPLAPREPDEDGGILLAGMRIALRPAGAALATDVAEPYLTGGERIPAGWGGGFLFWSQNAVYASRTFLAELRPVIGTRGRVASVSFGPSFALVRQSDGDRWVWDPAVGGRGKLTPAGLVDIASVPDGRVAAVLEGGRLATSVDGGKTWKDSTSRAQPWPSSLQAAPDGVWIGLGSAAALRLEKDGTLSEFTALPKKPDAREATKDARWTLPESPIERAFRRGVPIDDRSAWVEAAGAMARVDLRSGAILDMTRRVLPTDMSCESMRMGAEIVTACQGQHGRIVAASAASGEPVIEKTFEAVGRFSSGGSTLVFEGPCTGSTPAPGVICVRRAGAWSELDARAGFSEADAGNAKLEVTRWVPGEEQGAIGIVVRPVFGFLHARTGAFVDCVKDCKAQHADGLNSRAHDDVIDRTWVATSHGTLRGWTRDGSVTVMLDGTVIPSAYHWSGLRGVSAMGLAWDRDGRVWQSEDRGETWREVLGPPWLDNSRDPLECSEVGCILGPWLRVGWNAERPVVRNKPAVVRAPALARMTPVPTLTCVGTGEVQSSVANPGDNPTVQNEAGLGARLFSRLQGQRSVFRTAFGLGPLHPVISTDSTAFGLSALLHARVPEVLDGPNGPAPAGQGELENVYTWWYAEPFEPTITVRTATMRLRQMAEAAGVFRPALLTLNSDSDRPGVPVLSSTPGKAEGLLLGLEGGIWSWARHGRKRALEILTLGAEQPDPGEVISAVATGDDRVAILSVPSEGSVRVLELEQGKARMLFFIPPPPRREQYPANADALAIDAKGDLGVLRIPSGTEPSTREDPALLMRASGAPIELAPWSTLTTADAAECVNDAAGYRAIVQTQRAWLDVRNANAPVQDTRGMLAMVRWGATRVCLEAVMVGADQVDVRGNQIPTQYLAKFAGKLSATRFALVQGTEYRSNQTCRLQSAKP
ncbi:MAG: hypothetical protein HY898_01245 [Deltaproteobacteria bacterium]|nr:hypothetical protein [Deltaproteobacteria bacterium]